MTIEQIKPWIDLITWQVLALFAGVFLLPAVYIFLFRIKSGNLGGIGFEMGEKPKEVENRVEKRAEVQSAEEASAELNTLESEIANQDSSETLGERLDRVLTAWTNIQVVVKDRSKGVEGTNQDRRSTITNLRALRIKYPAIVLPIHVDRAEYLHSEIKQFKSKPELLTWSRYRAFASSAGHLAKHLVRIPRTVEETDQAEP